MSLLRRSLESLRNIYRFTSLASSVATPPLRTSRRSKFPQCIQLTSVYAYQLNPELFISQCPKLLGGYLDNGSGDQVSPTPFLHMCQ